jgi:hypothetical protein
MAQLTTVVDFDFFARHQRCRLMIEKRSDQ